MLTILNIDRNYLSFRNIRLPCINYSGKKSADEPVSCKRVIVRKVISNKCDILVGTLAPERELFTQDLRITQNFSKAVDVYGLPLLQFIREQCYLDIAEFLGLKLRETVIELDILALDSEESECSALFVLRDAVSKYINL